MTPEENTRALVQAGGALWADLPESIKTSFGITALVLARMHQKRQPELTKELLDTLVLLCESLVPGWKEAHGTSSTAP